MKIGREAVLGCDDSLETSGLALSGWEQEKNGMLVRMDGTI